MFYIPFYSLWHLILNIYSFIGSCIFSGRYFRFRLIRPKFKIWFKRIVPLFFDIFRTEGWNGKIYTYLESTLIWYTNTLISRLQVIVK